MSSGKITLHTGDRVRPPFVASTQGLVDLINEHPQAAALLRDVVFLAWGARTDQIVDQGRRAWIAEHHSATHRTTQAVLRGMFCLDPALERVVRTDIRTGQVLVTL